MNSTRQRVTGARWLLGAAVVLAVLGMHSLMTPHAAGGHVGASPSVSQQAQHPVMAEAGQHTGCAAGGCAATLDAPAPADETGHSLAHLCLAVLGGAAAALLLTLRPVSPAQLAAPRTLLRAVSRAAARPPSWTTPSLAELSVLRV